MGPWNILYIRARPDSGTPADHICYNEDNPGELGRFFGQFVGQEALVYLARPDPYPKK